MNIEWFELTRHRLWLKPSSVLHQFMLEDTATQYWRVGSQYCYTNSSSEQKENLWIMQVAHDQFHVIQYNRATGEHEIVHTFPGLESAKAYILLVDEM